MKLNTLIFYVCSNPHNFTIIVTLEVGIAQQVQLRQRLDEVTNGLLAIGSQMSRFTAMGIGRFG